MRVAIGAEEDDGQRARAVPFGVKCPDTSRRLSKRFLTHRPLTLISRVRCVLGHTELTGGGATMNTTLQDPRTREAGALVRLVYHYRDGHDFTTETMLRSQAVAYMPLLNAVAVDDMHFEAAFAEIEVLSA